MNIIFRNLTRFSKNGLLTIFRHTWSLLAFFLVIVALLFTLFRGLTPWVKHYRVQIQQELSAWIGQNVDIQDIQTSWYWFTPVLKLNRVTIGGTADQAVYFDQAMVGINLFSSLFHRSVQPGVLYINETHLNIRQQNNTWLIEGLSNPNSPPMLMPILALLLAQDKVIIKHVSADIIPENGTKMSLRDLYFKSDHHAQNYNIYAKAKVTGKPNTPITMIANLVLNGPNLQSLSGQVYLAVGQTDLSLIQQWLPQEPLQIKQGHGHIDTWWDIKHGHITHAQAALALNDVLLMEPSSDKPRKIKDVTANLAWDRMSEGWRLTGDQCLMTFDGIEWPDNAFMLMYREPSLDYRIHIKNLPLKQLLQTKLPWPKELQPIFALKPTGNLTGTEFTWKNGEVLDFLTQFSHLSWSAKGDIPGMTELSGALYWQPTEGRVELNGDHSVITLKKPLAPIKVDTLNLALDWKDLSQGTRYSLERLVLTHPNLVLSAAGALDNPGGTDEHLRLQVDYSAKDAQVWLPYIPAKGLKPKLNQWLKHDITRIANASGQIRIAGPTANFPFDNQEGNFSVYAHVSGTDLYINREWPLNSDINADIRVTGRNLTAEIDHARLLKTEIHQLNLLVPNIGSGKEVFLLHGVVSAPGEQIKSYVFASPLRKRMARWSGLNMSDEVHLELNLEVPLYPESDHVFAKGYLDFDNNPISVAFADNPAKFSGVSGRLYYNEYGLVNGGLEGTLDGYPFAMQVQPLAGQTAATDLRFEGEIGVDYLHHLVHHPIFSFMQGRFIVTGLWTVYPDKPDTDKLYLNSSLVGLALHLPQPLGKSLTEIVPLSITINFSPQHRMDFDVNYAQKVKGIFSLQQNWVTNGEFRIGKGLIKKSNASGLKISGVLPELNVNEWQKVWSQWPKEQGDVSLLASLKDVNLSIGKMLISDLVYPNVNFYLHLNTPQEWAFNVQQKDISGNFIYNWKKNSLAARIGKLHIETLQSSFAGASNTRTIKIENIPNLDFKIESLLYRGNDIGKLSFQSITKPGVWSLKTGTLQTPEYELRFNGDWTAQNDKNTSSLDAQLHVAHLKNALQRWDITPVVDAHYSQVSFSGTWADAFYAAALKKLNGQMNLVVKDGHISHLDRETEQKLGLGKLLSILSLQTIPRRLKLDFSDLAQEGYTFDIFKGNFQINKGVMRTDDSYIEGPVAFGRMSGKLDLVNQLYDLDLRIFPYVTASLPLVATIAGGPVVGVAAWAVSNLASKGVQKVSGYTYKISGPWLNPVVQQVSIDKSVH